MGNSIMWIYLVAINLLAFSMFGIDKERARHRKWRIPEAQLFLVALLGGAAGALGGMYAFRHKTQHWTFRFGLPLILLVQIAILFYIIFM